MHHSLNQETVSSNSQQITGRFAKTGSATKSNVAGLKMAYLHRLLVSEHATEPTVSGANFSVEWANVRCVDVMLDGVGCCPICLDDVIVPEILPCGHVFCLSCILLHFTSACNCCVCNEFARPSDLRSTRFQTVTSVQQGVSRTFHLTEIYGGLTLPVGVDFEGIPSQSACGWWFSKLAVIRDVEVQQLHLNERLRVQQLVSVSGKEGIHAFGPSHALEFIESRISSLGSELSLASEGNPVGSIPIDISTLSDISEHKLHAGSVYAYQLIDGQHVYLEPVWMRALLLHFTGSPDGWDCVDKLPRSLSLHILHVSSFTLGHPERQRYRQLNHLSLGTLVTLCDVDLRGVVDPDVLDSMGELIHRRLQLVKRVNSQRKVDKRDVKRANAVPLSREWGIAAIAPLANPLPRDADFVALPSNPNFAPLPASTISYARLAAGEGSLAPEVLARLVGTKKKGLKLRIAG